MLSRKYKFAARRFLEVSPELGTSYSTVIAPQDVAVYTTLCALATFERDELRTKVIANQALRAFLEHVPEMNELIHDFYNGRYASMLTILDRMKVLLPLSFCAFADFSSSRRSCWIITCTTSSSSCTR
jgi:COP9 signalosome complex subunit 1